MTRGRDVVLVYTSSTWEDGQRRGMCRGPDRLYQTLDADERVQRLLVANPFRSWPIRFARRTLGRRFLPFPHTPTRGLLQPWRMRRADPRSIAGLERAYRAYDRAVAGAARRMGLEEPSVIVFNPLAAAFSPMQWAGRVVVYLNDDWAASPWYRPWWPAIRTAYRRIAESGRPLCAVSEAIIDRVAPVGPAAVVPNGLDPSEWLHIGPPPDWFAGLPRPRGLYLGTLDSRLDLDAVESAAGALAGGTLILAGPVGLGLDTERLRRVPHTHVLPTLPRADVPTVVAAADVCLMPHVRGELTEAMSPLKLYEYLAGGRPVVATDLPPVRGVSSRVVSVSDSDDFGEAVRKSLTLPPQSESERRAFVEDNTWRQRHETVLQIALP